MKKTITLLLTLCLLLGLLPTEAVAFAGDIYRAGDVTQVKMADGSLSLQNGYVHVTLHKLLETYSYLTVAPTVKPDEDSMWNSQTPFCNYTTYNQGVPTTEGVVISLKKMEFVTGTPNGGGTKAIKAEYDLLSSHSHVAAKATVYYEIVQLKESGTAAKEDTWGVLTTVGSIEIIGGREQFTRDFDFRWGYYLNGFTSMGHSAMLEETGGPAIKISRTTVPEGEDPKITTESSHHRTCGKAEHKDRSQGLFLMGRCGRRLYHRGVCGQLPLGQSLCGPVGLLWKDDHRPQRRAAPCRSGAVRQCAARGQTVEFPCELRELCEL